MLISFFNRAIRCIECNVVLRGAALAIIVAAFAQATAFTQTTGRMRGSGLSLMSATGHIHAHFDETLGGCHGSGDFDYTADGSENKEVNSYSDSASSPVNMGVLSFPMSGHGTWNWTGGKNCSCTSTWNNSASIKNPLSIRYYVGRLGTANPLPPDFPNGTVVIRFPNMVHPGTLTGWCALRGGSSPISVYTWPDIAPIDLAGAKCDDVPVVNGISTLCPDIESQYHRIEATIRTPLLGEVTITGGLSITIGAK